MVTVRLWRRAIILRKVGILIHRKPRTPKHASVFGEPRTRGSDRKIGRGLQNVGTYDIVELYRAVGHRSGEGEWQEKGRAPYDTYSDL